jgi:hypothetical protein
MRLVKGMILDCCVRKSFNARTPPVGAVNAAAPVALGALACGMRVSFWPNRKKDELPGLLN